jgi:hypothetical protein
MASINFNNVFFEWKLRDITGSAVTGAVNIHLTLDKTISTEEGYTLQTNPPSKEIHITGVVC